MPISGLNPTRARSTSVSTWLKYPDTQEDRWARMDPDQGLLYRRQNIWRCEVPSVPDRQHLLRYCCSRKDTLPGGHHRSDRPHGVAPETRCRGYGHRQRRGGAVIDDALAALRDGKFILLYDFDDREGETDFAIRSDAVTPRHIVQMRKDGGGLICTACTPDCSPAPWAAVCKRCPAGNIRGRTGGRYSL